MLLHGEIMRGRLRGNLHRHVTLRLHLYIRLCMRLLLLPHRMHLRRRWHARWHGIASRRPKRSALLLHLMPMYMLPFVLPVLRRLYVRGTSPPWVCRSVLRAICSPRISCNAPSARRRPFAVIWRG